MARMTAEEMAGAVEILPAASGYDPDMAEAFDDLRESLEGAQSDSTLWVHRVPLDERGDVISNAKHVHLFTAPLDRYKLDEIITKVKADYMGPNERRACIRLMAKKAGVRGNAFNRLVLIEKELKPQNPGGESQRESVTEIVRAIQESTNAQLAAFRQMLAERSPPAPAKDPLEMAVSLMGVMTNMMAQLNKAAPVAAAGGTGTLIEQIRAMKELKELAGDLVGVPGEGGGDDNSTAGIIKAVAPLAAPLLQMMAQNQAANAATRPTPRALPNPAARAEQPSGPQGRPMTTTASAPGAVPPVHSNPTPKSEDEKMIAELRAQLVAICEAASQGADPAALGSVIVHQLPVDSAIEESLLGLLDDPLWMQKLASIHPGVKDHAEFFNTVRATIFAAYDVETTQPEVSPVSPPAST